jgi:hypothetical protein
VRLLTWFRNPSRVLCVAPTPAVVSLTSLECEAATIAMPDSTSRHAYAEWALPLLVLWSHAHHDLVLSAIKLRAAWYCQGYCCTGSGSNKHQGQMGHTYHTQTILFGPRFGLSRARLLSKAIKFDCICVCAAAALGSLSTYGYIRSPSTALGIGGGCGSKSSHAILQSGSMASVLLHPLRYNTEGR